MVKKNKPTVSSGIGKNARDVWSGERITPNAEQQMLGFYIGQVMDDQDDQLMGRVWVYIPEVSTPRFDADSIPGYGATTPDRQTSRGLDFDQHLRNGWILVSPMSPISGSDDYRNQARPDGTNAAQGVVNSYGMWSQPRVGDFLGIMFSGGDPNSGYYIGSVHKTQRNSMIPGVPGVKAQDVSNTDNNEVVQQVQGDAELPAMVKVPTDNDPTGGDVTTSTDLARNIARAGVSGDSLRGAGSSGARRESPSYVTGIKTAGWSYDSEKYNKNIDGGQFQNNARRYYDKNTTGHQLVMDDHPDNQLMRMRTSNGSQILMADSCNNPFIYLQTAKGNAWIEMSDSGDVSIFAAGGLHIHAETDLNLTVDGNLNFGVTGNVDWRVGGDFNLGVDGLAQIATASDAIIGIEGSLDLDVGTATRATFNNDLDVRVGSNFTKSVSGTSEISVGASARQYTGGDFDFVAEGGVNINSADAISMNSGGALTGTMSGVSLQSATSIDLLSAEGFNIESGQGMNIKSGDTIAMESGGTFTMLGGGNFAVDAPQVDLNSGVAGAAGSAGTATTISIGDFTTADVAAPPIFPPLKKTAGAPTDGEILANDNPENQETVAGVVPQHQPWPGRCGVGETAGTRGLVTPQPVAGGVIPTSRNITCTRTNLQSNLRTGSGFSSSSLPDSIVSLFDQTNGQIPGFLAPISFNGVAQGEAPQYKQVRLASQRESHSTDSLEPSDEVIKYIKSQSNFYETPQIDPLEKNYIVGYSHQLRVGDVVSGRAMTPDDLATITSLSNDSEKSYKISQEEADAFLQTELDEVQTWMDTNITDTELTQTQYDAIFSFIHNVTPDALESSTEGQAIVQGLQTGDMGTVQSNMYQFSHVGGAVDCSVLERRRTEVGAFSQIPNRDGITTQNIGYVPAGTTVTIAGFVIESEVFNAICYAQDNIAPQLPDGYLFAICAQESAFNPNAKAATSSAAGLFQFIKATGAQYGLSTDRSASSNVFDPIANANAGALFAADNHELMINAGYSPDATMLYLAHFLGPGSVTKNKGALYFLDRLTNNPSGTPATDPAFVAAANANKSIFKPRGVNRTYAEIFTVFQNKIGRRAIHFTGVCTPPGQGGASGGATPPSNLTNPDGSGSTTGPDASGAYRSNINLIDWYPGKRTPTFENTQLAIINIVETSAVEAGLPKLIFNSGYRDATTNANAGGAKNSQHLQGKALDIHIGWMTLAQKRAFVERLAINGVTGMGVGTNTIHADDRTSGPVTWKYRGGNSWCADILTTYGFRGV